MGEIIEKLQVLQALAEISLTVENKIHDDGS